MQSNNKRRIRHYVEENGYTIIWPCSEMPNEFADEVVELLYLDMDGNASKCEAIYTYDREDKFRHRPYFKRIPDGSRMVNCMAWRYK